MRQFKTGVWEMGCGCVAVVLVFLASSFIGLTIARLLVIVLGDR